MDKFSTSWAESEREKLAFLMQREQYGWYLTFLYWMFSFFSGREFMLWMFFLVCIPATYCVYHILNSERFIKYRLAIVIVYFEAVQFFNYKCALELPNEAPTFFQTSTMILVLRQLSPLFPWPVNTLLIVKHVWVWYMYCLGNNSLTNMSGVAFVSLCWSVYHMYTNMTINKRVLESEYFHLQSLRRKEQHMTALYDTLPNGILVMTEDNKVVTYNSMLLEFLAIQMKSGVEEEVYSRIAQLKYDQEYATGQSQRITPVLTDIMEYIVSDRRDLKNIGVVLLNSKYLEWSTKKLEWDNKNACIICVRDITRWIELEAIAKKESISKSALIRSVSHELRTPTNAIINLARDINDNEALSEIGLQDINLLSSSSHFLLNLINDLLDFSNITDGKFGLTKQVFQLESTIRECVQLIEFQCKHKNLELILRYDPLLPALVYNDKNRLKQVVLNLLSNAMKFTMTGKIEVVVISVSDTHAGIEVIDTGIGISEQSIGKIFKLFGKFERNEKLIPQGCGLGLNISNLLVKEMGGSGLHVTSTRYIGSIFSFEFAITANETSMIPNYTSIDFPGLPEEMREILVPGSITIKSEATFSDILIADDVDFNRIVLRKILEAMGYDCDEASTGIQVLERVKARADLGKPYLVILMDVEMPEMDGNTATQELVAMVDRGELKSFPVVIGCSAYSSVEERKTSLRAGMQYYLEKPIIRENLSDLLSGVIPRGVFRYHYNHD